MMGRHRLILHCQKKGRSGQLEVGRLRTCLVFRYDDIGKTGSNTADYCRAEK